MRLEKLQDLLASLADATRLRVLHLLFAHQDEDWTVTAIVDVLELPQPTVSRHLARLREQGLVDVETVGRFRLYRLADLQTSLDRALLAALEPFVASTPEAQQDLRRAVDVLQKKDRLTRPLKNATGWLHDESEGRRSMERQEEMGALFKALAARRRRALLDGIQRKPGATMADVADEVDVSRQAVRKHLDVLADADLVHIVEDGRQRRIYYNPVPLQLLYERWTDERSRVLASRMVGVKERVERADRPQGDEDG